MKKTLYVSDLDGTLLDGSSHITVRSAELLNRAIGAGALFTIATARTPATVSKIVRGVDMRLPLIVMTGAALWDMHSNRYSDVKCFPRDTAEELLSVYERGGLPTFVYTLRGDIIHIYHVGCTSHIERAFIAERVDNPYKRFHLSSEGCVRLMPDKRAMEEVVLFYAMQPTAEAGAVYREIRNRGIDCNALYYHDIYGPETAVLEAFAPEATKAAAVRSMAERLGAEEIVVFGDNVNDLPMMEIATRAVATANAIESVKERADVVIGANTEDSVARYIVTDMGI